MWTGYQHNRPLQTQYEVISTVIASLLTRAHTEMAYFITVNDDSIGGRIRCEDNFTTDVRLLNLRAQICAKTTIHFEESIWIHLDSVSCRYDPRRPRARQEWGSRPQNVLNTWILNLFWVLSCWFPFFWQRVVFWIPVMGSGVTFANNLFGGGA